MNLDLPAWNLVAPHILSASGIARDPLQRDPLQRGLTVGSSRRNVRLPAHDQRSAKPLGDAWSETGYRCRLGVFSVVL